jgi:hypothetical protein
MEETISLSRLYYRYKKISDDEIRKNLQTIRLVRLENKGVGTLHGYYPLSKKSIDKIIKKPRNVSLTFDAHETAKTPIKNLVEYKKITFLVKSSSRFFLKPDVGEIFDQIPMEEMWGNILKAICINEEYETLDGTEGEHFLMTASLLTNSKI